MGLVAECDRSDTICREVFAKENRASEYTCCFRLEILSERIGSQAEQNALMHLKGMGVGVLEGEVTEFCVPDWR